MIFIMVCPNYFIWFVAEQGHVLPACHLICFFTIPYNLSTCGNLNFNLTILYQHSYFTAAAKGALSYSAKINDFT